MFTKLLTNRRLRKSLNQRFYYRDILEVVRKREEFRLLLNEALKDKKSNGEVSKYRNYIYLMNWIINCKDDAS